MLPDELEPSAGLFPLDEQKNPSDEDGEMVEGILNEQQRTGGHHKEVARNSYFTDTIKLVLGIYYEHRISTKYYRWINYQTVAVAAQRE